MQRNSIIILFIALLFFVSCSSSKSQNDSDILPDTDTNSQDSEGQDDDSDTQEAEIVDDSDVKPDVDADQDTDSTECQPPLSEATFPYYDKDGKITFCRPGCDTPTEKDPQCVRNLWDEQNEKLCHEYPEYACCGTPCVMGNLKPWTKDGLAEEYPTIAEVVPMHKCDLAISQVNWNNDGTNGVVKSWNMSDGKIGFYFAPNPTLSVKDWAVKTKYVTYDIAIQKYSLVIPARGQEQAYHKGKRLALISDKRNLDLNNSNIFLAYIGDDGKVEIVYDKKVKSISYEPALNEKWAFVNLVEAGNERMMYAKVGEWKWTSLGDGLGLIPSIVGDRLALYQDDFKGYICDLNKYPKNLDECYNVNNGEKVRYVTLDKEDSNRAAYSANQGKIVLMEYRDGKWNYSDLITSFSDEITGKVNMLGFIINMFRGNMLLYEEAFNMGSQSQIMANKLCYYNMKSKKAYCMKKMENDSEYDGIPVYPYGDAEFEGNWLLYQKLSSTSLILRDMECYCREENICPFEE